MARPASSGNTTARSFIRSKVSGAASIRAGSPSTRLRRSWKVRDAIWQNSSDEIELRSNWLPGSLLRAETDTSPSTAIVNAMTAQVTTIGRRFERVTPAEVVLGSGVHGVGEDRHLGTSVRVGIERSSEGPGGVFGARPVQRAGCIVDVSSRRPGAFIRALDTLQSEQRRPSQTIDIRGRGRGCSVEDLGGDVVHGAPDVIKGGFVLGDDPRNPEIAQSGGAVAGNENVRWLHVAVNDARFVGGAERARHLNTPRQDCRGLTTRFCSGVGVRAAANIIDHQVRDLIIRGAGLDEVDDMSVPRERRESQGLGGRWFVGSSTVVDEEFDDDASAGVTLPRPIEENCRAGRHGNELVVPITEGAGQGLSAEDHLFFPTHGVDGTSVHSVEPLISFQVGRLVSPTLECGFPAFHERADALA